LNFDSAFAKRIEVPINRNDKSTGEVYCQTKSLNPGLPFDFPMINYFRNNGRDYQYVYGMTQDFKKPSSVIKMDVTNPSKTIEFVYGEAGQIVEPGEPVFVARPNGESEDDGVLLVMVLSDKSDYLSILDGRDLKEVARADLPKGVRGAFNFHGFFAEDHVYKNLNV
jgi:beta,beta-carotene 9',10'-dioxygenase